jgi:hypothetical protein
MRTGLQPASEPVRRLLAERDDPFFPTFAEHSNGFAVEVDVREVEVDRLLAPEACRVDQLAERSIPQLERVVRSERVELGVDLIGFRSRGEAARPAGCQPGVRDTRRPDLRAIVAGASVRGSRPARAAPSSAA